MRCHFGTGKIFVGNTLIEPPGAVLLYTDGMDLKFKNGPLNF
jgi:hypothetical protein